jgi:predicted 3-demethylubiquinone-9 3-methyltransferase (glyoxalase superfamily)
MQKVTPFLWFKTEAEEAAKFYVTLVKNSKILGKGKSAHDATGKKGSVFSVRFTLDGHEYIAFNGGPHFQFTPAISLFVECKDQKEVDRLWNKILKHGGKASRCGWISDKYGLSWQIIPKKFNDLTADENPKKVAAVMQAMMGMIKFDVKALQKAYDAA